MREGKHMASVFLAPPPGEERERERAKGATHPLSSLQPPTAEGKSIPPREREVSLSLSSFIPSSEWRAAANEEEEREEEESLSFSLSFRGGGRRGRSPLPPPPESQPLHILLLRSVAPLDPLSLRFRRSAKEGEMRWRKREKAMGGDSRFVQ